LLKINKEGIGKLKEKGEEMDRSIWDSAMVLKL
jgi:hypothetical protein